LEQKEKLSSKQMLNDLMANHYKSAMEAKENGELVAWATSIAPQELLTTMDISVVYPENHAAAIGARKEAQKFIDNSEGRGYSIDLCSYARVNFGYAQLKYAEAENIPMPDFIYSCSNICHTVLKWYENLAKELNIPLIIFDLPFNHTYDVQPHAAKYMKGQIEEAIKKLENITGKIFDYDKFSAVMEQSNKTSQMWKDATLVARAKPSPLSGFDLFNYMAGIVTNRGTQAGYELFKRWKEELEEKAAAGLGPWKPGEEEKYRVMWDGIACWPYLGPTYKGLKNNGINMVTSTYPDSWTILYENGDVEGMAKAYSSIYCNSNIQNGIDRITGIVNDFDLDGIVFHSNRSCKLLDFRQFEQQRQIEEKCGVATVLFDGDQTDPRAFSTEQYNTRIQAFLETMENKKEERRKG